jgi:hypothetical protein
MHMHCIITAYNGAGGAGNALFNISRYGCFVPGRSGHGSYRIQELVVPRVRVNVMTKRNPCLCRESSTGLPTLPVTDRDIPAHTVTIIIILSDINQFSCSLHLFCTSSIISCNLHFTCRVQTLHIPEEQTSNMKSFSTIYRSSWRCTKILYCFYFWH